MTPHAIGYVFVAEDMVFYNATINCYDWQMSYVMKLQLTTSFLLQGAEGTILPRDEKHIYLAIAIDK